MNKGLFPFLSKKANIGIGFALPDKENFGRLIGIDRLDYNLRKKHEASTKPDEYIASIKEKLDNDRDTAYDLMEKVYKRYIDAHYSKEKAGKFALSAGSKLFDELQRATFEEFPLDDLMGGLNNDAKLTKGFDRKINAKGAQALEVPKYELANI